MKGRFLVVRGWVMRWRSRRHGKGICVVNMTVTLVKPSGWRLLYSNMSLIRVLYAVHHSYGHTPAYGFPAANMYNMPRLPQHCEALSLKHAGHSYLELKRTWRD